MNPRTPQQNRRPFAVSIGSVAGREHVRCFRPLQDAAAARWTGEALVCAVADGCSAGRASQLGAHFAVAWALAHAAALTTPAAFDAALHQAMERQLDLLAGATPADRRASIADYLLFTLLVAVITPVETRVFAAGDGLVAVDGALEVLEPGAGNAPRYPAYRNLPDAGGYATGQTKLVAERPTPDLHSLLLATDGALELRADGHLAGYLDEPRYMRNGSLLQKHLNALSARSQQPFDDATVLVVRRWEAS